MKSFSTIMEEPLIGLQMDNPHVAGPIHENINSSLEQVSKNIRINILKVNYTRICVACGIHKTHALENCLWTHLQTMFITKTFEENL